MAGEGMNPAALLHLIASLYDQLLSAQTRVEELEAQIAGPPPNGDQSVKDFAASREG